MYHAKYYASLNFHQNGENRKQIKYIYNAKQIIFQPYKRPMEYQI